MQFTVHNTTGKSTTLEGNDVVFAAKANPVLIAQAVRVFLSNQRQGSVKKKTRSEINRTKTKWFKQKGTGNARHGARTPNIFVGGGLSHAPNGEQNWTKDLSKQMKRKAMIAALSAQNENIIVTTVFGDIQPKTKDAVAFLKKLAPDSKRTLVVLHENMDNIVRSMQNLSNVVLTTSQHLNILDVVFADTLIMTKEAVKQVEQRLAPDSKESQQVSKSTAEAKKVSEVKEAKKITKPAIKKTAEKKSVKTDVKKSPAKKVTPKKKVK